MCTYNLTFNDSLMEEAKRAFPTQIAIKSWMETQIERMLKQIAVPVTEPKEVLRKIEISDKIKALSAVPASNSHADYKEEIEDILSYKY